MNHSGRNEIIAISSLIFFTAIVANHSLIASGTSVLIASSTTTSRAYQLIQYHLPTGSSLPWSIVTDSKGNAWFTEQNSNQIGMFDPIKDHFTEYDIPTPNSSPLSITVDTIDDVWFTELSSNKLGEIKSGMDRITEYNIPGGSLSTTDGSNNVSCGPAAIASDTTGNEWISCLFSNQIDEFIPTNDTFFSFKVPIFDSSVAGFAFTGNASMWFTAAGVGMLGEVTISELRNGTSDGIKEFAPINATYLLNDAYPFSLAGPTIHNVSSLPTPAGIVFDPETDSLLITEHVDSSFDSYNIQNKTLDRYWTSQTMDEYGYPVSLPNGIDIDSNGNVSIAEHYGNKIAEFIPSSRELVEYLIPCCNSSLASPYQLTIGKNNTIWFVETSANSIGELRLANSSDSFEISTHNDVTVLNNNGNVTIPVTMTLGGQNTTADEVSMSVSGISLTGALENASATFSPDIFKISSNQSEVSVLVIVDRGLRPGTYDLTVSANLTAEHAIYSTIISVRASSEVGFSFTSEIDQNILEYSGLAVAVMFIVIILRRRMR